MCHFLDFNICLPCCEISPRWNRESPVVFRLYKNHTGNSHHTAHLHLLDNFRLSLAFFMSVVSTRVGYPPRADLHPKLIFHRTSFSAKQSKVNSSLINFPHENSSFSHECSIILPESKRRQQRLCPGGAPKPFSAYA